MTALSVGMKCDCGERAAELPRTALLCTRRCQTTSNAACAECAGSGLREPVRAVARHFAARGEIELTYEGRWRCPQCGARPAFWCLREEADHGAESPC